MKVDWLKDIAWLILAASLSWSVWTVAQPAARLLWTGERLVGHLDAQLAANAGDMRAIVASGRRIAGEGEAISANVNGITGSVNSMAWKAAQPETKGQKIIGGLKIGALLLSKFVP